MYIFENGSGSAEDPFLIQSLADLQGIDDVDGDGNPNFIGRHFRQTVDIDAAGFNTINSFMECHYDGNGRKITDLDVPFINWYGWDTAAEKYVNSLRNLTFEDCSAVLFFDCHYVFFDNVHIDRGSGFSKYLSDCRLKDCSSKNIIAPSGFDAIGGQTVRFFGAVAAQANRTKFEACEVDTVEVESSTGYVYYIGGFAGSLNDCEAIDLKVRGFTHTMDLGASVTPSSDTAKHIGGAIGSISGCEINGLSVEDVAVFMRFYSGWARDRIGGAIGYFYDGKVSNARVKNVNIQRINGLPGTRCFAGGFSGELEAVEAEDCLAYDVAIKARWGGGFSCYASQYGDGGYVKRSAVVMATLESDIDCQNVSSPDRKRIFGGMVAFADDYTFEECWALGITIPAADEAGGFAYETWQGSFSKCISKSGITLDGEYIQLGGGFVGYSMGTSFEQCGAEVDLSGSAEPSDSYILGGFAGYCLASSGVSSSFEDCFALGEVSGAEGASVPRAAPLAYGGFAGLTMSYDSHEFAHCLAVVDLTKRGEPEYWPFYCSGGFIGMTDPYGSAAVTDCFYDSNVSGHNDAGKGEPLSTALMKNPSVLTGFDFDTVWKIGPWSISGPKSVTDSKGEYSMAMKDGAINVYLEYDPSGGYPFLQFETKKAVSKSGKTKCDFYVR